GCYLALEIVRVRHAEDLVADLRGGGVGRGRADHDDACLLQYFGRRDGVGRRDGSEDGEHAFVYEAVGACDRAFGRRGVVADGQLDVGARKLQRGFDALQRGGTDRCETTRQLEVDPEVDRLSQCETRDGYDDRYEDASKDELIHVPPSFLRAMCTRFGRHGHPITAPPNSVKATSASDRKSVGQGERG